MGEVMGADWLTCHFEIIYGIFQKPLLRPVLTAAPVSFPSPPPHRAAAPAGVWVYNRINHLTAAPSQISPPVRCRDGTGRSERFATGLSTNRSHNLHGRNFAFRCPVFITTWTHVFSPSSSLLPFMTFSTNSYLTHILSSEILLWADDDIWL